MNEIKMLSNEELFEKMLDELVELVELPHGISNNYHELAQEFKWRLIDAGFFTKEKVS